MAPPVLLIVIAPVAWMLPPPLPSVFEASSTAPLLVVNVRLLDSRMFPPALASKALPVPVSVMFALMLILRAAVSVSAPAPVPVVATALLTVMSPLPAPLVPELVVVTVTSVPAFNAVSSVVTLTTVVAAAALGTKLASWPRSVPVEMVTSAGSINH